MKESIMLATCMCFISLTSCESTTTEGVDRLVTEALSPVASADSLSLVIPNVHLRNEIVQFFITTNSPIVGIYPSLNSNSVVLSNASCLYGPSLRNDEVNMATDYVRGLIRSDSAHHLNDDALVDLNQYRKYFECDGRLLILRLPDNLYEDHIHFAAFSTDFGKLIGTKYECSGIGHFEPIEMTVALRE